MAVVAVSVCVLAGIVFICEIARKVIPELLSARRRDRVIDAAEIISTLQLCSCSHELKLLSEEAPGAALSLTYALSLVHALTFRGATGNPTATLERYWCRALDATCALRRTACQFAASVAAGLVMRCAWAFGFSDLHARHERAGFTCASPISSVPLLEAVAAEFACAFVVHAAATFTRNMQAKYRVHAVAAVITTVVYAGGSKTGAVFNPALAFSAQFPCTGSTFAQNSLVYWLGPVLATPADYLVQVCSVTQRVGDTKSPGRPPLHPHLKWYLSASDWLNTPEPGMACSLLLFNKVILAFTTKSTSHKDQNLHSVKKKKKRN